LIVFFKITNVSKWVLVSRTERSCQSRLCRAAKTRQKHTLPIEKKKSLVDSPGPTSLQRTTHTKKLEDTHTHTQCMSALQTAPQQIIDFRFFDSRWWKFPGFGYFGQTVTWQPERKDSERKRIFKMEQLGLRAWDNHWLGACMQRLGDHLKKSKLHDLERVWRTASSMSWRKRAILSRTPCAGECIAKKILPVGLKILFLHSKSPRSNLTIQSAYWAYRLGRECNDPIALFVGQLERLDFFPREKFGGQKHIFILSILVNID